MDESLVPGSPLWWTRRLYAEIVGRRPHLDRLRSYYDGDHPLGFASTKFRETFGGLFNAFADNWCELIVEAVEERLTVVGFRIDPEQQATDDAAWRIWQDNELDAQSKLAHSEALISGTAYATVWLNDDGGPEVTVSSPAECTVACSPKIHRHRRAALRVYRDDWGFEHAELFLPDDVYLLRSPTARDGDDVLQPEQAMWVADEIDGAVDGRMPNPLGVVPVVELPNKPRLRQNVRLGVAARSELTAIIPLQDAVNKLIADLLVTSEDAALPMRYGTGIEVQIDPMTKQLIPPAWTRPGAKNAVIEDPQAKFGSLPAADLSGFVESIGMIVQHVASISRTPPHYLNASADRLSGESIKAAETGLVAKVRGKMLHFGEGWEEVMRLAGRLAGDESLAKASKAETIWGDPETRTEAEHMDAILKQKAFGVPDEILQEKAGYSPVEIARIRRLKAQEALLAAQAPQGGDASAAKAQADALGALIRAGVDPVDAANQVGLGGLTFTGAVPVSLRLPEGEARGLEGT